LRSACNSLLGCLQKEQIGIRLSIPEEEAFELLRNARKAWIYTYIRHNTDTTIDDVVDSLEIPQRTAYDYINDLESAGFIEQSNKGRPARYAARKIDLQLVQDDVQRQITPALIEAIARREGMAISIRTSNATAWMGLRSLSSMLGNMLRDQ